MRRLCAKLSPSPLSLGGEKQAGERGYADTIPIKQVKTGAS